jgi:hypothetical protein
MTMRLVVLLVVLGGSVAHADDLARLWVGGDLELEPFGYMRSTDAANDIQYNFSTQHTAYGIGAVADFQVAPMLALGFAPRAVVNIAPKNWNEATYSLIDLRARVLVGKTFRHRLRPYGFGTIGYGLVVGGPREITDVGGGTGSTWHGPTFGAGVGAWFLVDHDLRVFAECSYELGFEREGNSADHVDLLAVSIGFAVLVGR